MIIFYTYKIVWHHYNIYSYITSIRWTVLNKKLKVVKFHTGDVISSRTLNV